MSWLSNLRTAWRHVPASIRRLILAALVVSLALLVFSFIGPPDLQLVAVLALVGLFVMIQVGILWIMWRQNPEVRQARKAYTAHDYPEAVRILLAAEREKGQLDVMGQTLLGNAYRQLGQLEDSERVLRAAYEAEPDTPFAAYGLGRTRLVQGAYTEAVTLIEQAYQNRAAQVILADLGQAYYLAGQSEAGDILDQAARLNLQPHRALMTVYLRWRLSGEASDEVLLERLRRYDHGLAYWQAELERFRDTPYGEALGEDLARIDGLLGSE